MMSNKATDSDGFTVVNYKARRKCKIRNTAVPVLKPGTEHKVSDVFHKSNFEMMQAEVKSSDFFVNFKENLNTALENLDVNIKYNYEEQDIAKLAKQTESLSLNNTEKICIVCYGLGSFLSSPSARYQLAFLMVLKDTLEPSSISVYDPVFSTEEKTVLNDLGLNVLNINEEGKRIVSNRTIFFMPHCDLPLYNNLLWANWNTEKLSDVIIIGNSFKMYHLQTPELKLKQKASYVYYAYQFVSEIKMKNDFRFIDIFNDLSLHYFQFNALSEVPVQVWSDNSEPVYAIEDDIVKNVL